MDCAALFDLSNRMAPERANHGKGLVLSRMAERLERAALDEAVTEGQGDPGLYIARTKAEKIDHWDRKGTLFVFSEEFKDWMAYCRKFSAHMGVDFDDLR
ncbi:hypothetical protein [Cognatishimia sp. MH4019]|uniref:hypothetical protein n=1 Tax=Cognatishimia sp. MH4019 TaxID=2854030 RepID=UPI001CD50E36|nr:hypothetical protein [Cognatishimia sp. MH4019]